MLSEPPISVLVPTYNSADYLPATLRSILAQTDPDFELVTCDDGSTDRTLDVLAEFDEIDPRVRIERNTVNLGLHGNLVRMMHLARGRLIKIVMADDLLLPDALARLRAPLDADPEVILSTSRRLRIDQNGQRLCDTAHLEPPVPASSRIDGRTLGNVLLERQVNLVGEPSTVMFRRADVVPEEAFCIAGNRYSALVDMALWINLLARGDCYYEVDALSCYRQHDGQLGAAMQMVDRVEWMRLLIDAPSLGYLTDPLQEARALQHRIADTMAQGLVDVDRGLAPMLEAVQPLIGRLAVLHRTAAPEIGADMERFRARMAGDPALVAQQVAAGPADAPTRVPAPRPADGRTELATRPVDVVLAATSGDALTTTLAALADCLPSSLGRLLVLDTGVPAAALAHLPADAVVLPAGAVSAGAGWHSALSTAVRERVLLLSDDVATDAAGRTRLARTIEQSEGVSAAELTGFAGVCGFSLQVPVA